MKFSPIASESLGVRSLSSYVKLSNGTSILMDPGAALGPKRYGYRPHKREYIALKEKSNKIYKLSNRADIITVSHYHFDHYTPSFENYFYNWSTEEKAIDVIKDKKIFAKHPKENINYSQKKRAYYFEKICRDHSKEINYADRKDFKIGDAKLEFSPPVYHGPKGTKLGFVVMTAITESNKTLIHASDVQGPINTKAFKWIKKRNPNLLIVAGPPEYLVPSKLKKEKYEKALKNIRNLSENTKILVDHHILRSKEGQKIIANEEKIMTFADFLDVDNNFLESNRKKLHRKEPCSDEFYRKIKDGYYVENDIK
ncbi:MAG: Metallo-beta-lactamase superfamily hydrolase [Candidatus Methanohalarchaeum thermophilum]|uniref:UPF0282 protein BTN85_1656 n=1 Tax=Methanohalarchaeum thermophilum TaxID=1903181 RepID=A0A1Q6DXP7_METT1|nr:MAG: Metallo-beta-lactamase superfamily hydrolase [Candidatus Methanohalarchaeum thermophilum]